MVVRFAILYLGISIAVQIGVKGAGLMCLGVGDYPDLQDCRRIHKCRAVGEEAAEFYCPPGMVFDRKCVSPHFTKRKCNEGEGQTRMVGSYDSRSGTLNADAGINDVATATSAKGTSNLKASNENASASEELSADNNHVGNRIEEKKLLENHELEGIKGKTDARASNGPPLVGVDDSGGKHANSGGGEDGTKIVDDEAMDYSFLNSRGNMDPNVGQPHIKYSNVDVNTTRNAHKSKEVLDHLKNAFHQLVPKDLPNKVSNLFSNTTASLKLVIAKRLDGFKQRMKMVGLGVVEFYERGRTQVKLIHSMGKTFLQEAFTAVRVLTDQAVKHTIARYKNRLKVVVKERDRLLSEISTVLKQTLNKIDDVVGRIN